MKKAISLLLAMTISFTCFAGGKVIGNGGDDIALEFYKIGLSAIAEIKDSIELYPELKDVNLVEVINSTEILVSENPIYSLKKGVSQFSTAINYNDPNTIVVYGPRWSRTNNVHIRKALALHEVLSLAGIENTGNYTISKRYLKNLGMHCSEGLCENLPRYTCNFRKSDLISPQVTLETINVGYQGSDNEFLEFSPSEKMRATIAMDSSIITGYFIMVLYYNDKIVGRTAIRGTSFSPFVMLEWQNFDTNTSWTVDCTQD